MTQVQGSVDTRGFYMLWVQGRSSPNVTHGSYQAAKMEAERLLRQKGVSRVFILRATNMIEEVEVPVRNVELSRPPAVEVKDEDGRFGGLGSLGS